MFNSIATASGTAATKKLQGCMQNLNVRVTMC